MVTCTVRTALAAATSYSPLLCVPRARARGGAKRVEGDYYYYTVCIPVPGRAGDSVIYRPISVRDLEGGTKVSHYARSNELYD